MFPVSEHPFTVAPDGTRKVNEKGFYGKSSVKGFQSHITAVNLRDFPNCYPVGGGPIDQVGDVLELVVFQESQTLPLFVLKLHEKGEN